MWGYIAALTIAIIIIVYYFATSENYSSCRYCDEISQPRGLYNPFVWPHSSGECTPGIISTQKLPFVHRSTPDHPELVGYGMG